MLRAFRSWLPADQSSKFRAKWEEVCRFFTMVHGNAIQENTENYMHQLSDVENNLKGLLECLLAERREIESNQSQRGGDASLPKCYEMLIKIDKSPNGIIFHLCQHAKHNEPPGVRRVMLDFLAELLTKADLEDQPLLGCHEHVFLPLYDMVTRLASALDPTKASKNVVSEEEMLMLHDDRVAFLTFMCALCHRLDENNMFVELFMSGDDASDFTVVSYLEPYVAYNPLLSSALSSKKASDPLLFDTLLRSFLYLVRLRDTRVPALLLKDARLATNLFTEATLQTQKFISNGDKTGFSSKVHPFFKFLDGVMFCSGHEEFKGQVLGLFATHFIPMLESFFHSTKNSDQVVMNISGVILHLLNTLRSPVLLEYVADRLICGNETAVDVIQRRLEDVNVNVVAVTLCVLRCLTERVPVFVHETIITPFLQKHAESTDGAFSIPNFKVITSQMFSRAAQRGSHYTDEGLLEDYKADVHYRTVVSTALIKKKDEIDVQRDRQFYYDASDIISALLTKMNSVLESPPSVTIPLTGVFSNLLLLGHGRLASLLLRQDITTTNTLAQVLKRLSVAVEAHAEADGNFTSGISATRKSLFGDLAMNPMPSTMTEGEYNLYAGAAVLEEFRLEMGALVSMAPMWVHSQ
eukprot:PhM_4_TR1860/c0_g1_i1/m.6956